MGLNLAGGFGQFANALIQKIKQALEYLNNEPDHAGRGTVECYGLFLVLFIIFI